MMKASIALLALLVPAALACSCFPRTFEQHIDDADTVARVEVLAGPFDVGVTRYYVVRVRDHFKAPATATCLTCSAIGLVRTSISSAACGVTLAVGQQYLIASHGTTCDFGIPIFNLNLCMFYDLWCKVAGDKCRQQLLDGLGGKCKELCTLEYKPVCAECAGQKTTFGNACQAGAAGYTIQYQGKCVDCFRACQAHPIFCFWGTPRCCKDGTQQCPSGGNPSHPSTWTYNCRPCTAVLDITPIEATLEGLVARKEITEKGAATLKEAIAISGDFASKNGNLAA